MELLGYITLIVILVFAWNHMPDDGKLGNVKWILGMIPLTIVTVPLLPGVVVHWGMVEGLGFKKEHWAVGLFSVVGMFAFWCLVVLYFAPR